MLDEATYMPVEYIQKEKEYGITWRTAFKAELLEKTQTLCKRTIDSDGFNAKFEDPFEILHKVVKRDCIDAAIFDQYSQADLLYMLFDNLELVEDNV